MSVIAPTDSKKLVEALLGDLRLLSTESRKKYNHVKEAAESGVVRVRNISTASSDSSLLTNLRSASSELLHPLALACATRNARLVQIALQGIQRLVQHRILEPSCANVVVTELWNLVEAECEELRVLQTVPPLVSADLLVTGNNLAKCIVMCFRMHFAKDPVVINAASAAVRQLVGGVFERVVQEDGVFSGELTVVPPSGGRPSPRSAPPTLRPCAADAYMLFRDLCLLINAEPAIWLVGMREITRTLGLELLETLLKCYPGVFFKHSEMGALVKQEVCQLVIKLFSPNLKSVHITSQHPSARGSSAVNPGGSPSDRPFFPIAMRLVRIIVVLISYYHQLLPTECEIFVSHLLKFVSADKKGWQRVIALEALHRIVAKPDILRWLSLNFDSRASCSKVISQIAGGMATVIQQSFVPTQISSDPDNTDTELAQQSGLPGFFIRGVWVPYVEQLTTKKTVLLDSLERHEANAVPDGYVVSRCCSALADMAQSTFAAIDQLTQQDENSECSSNREVAIALYESAFPGLITGLSLLLSASTEETVTDQLLCAVSTLVAVGCKLGATEATQRALYVLCAASLPSPSYLPKYASIPVPSVRESEILFEAEAGSAFHYLVATGPPCPSPVVSPELWNQQVMLTTRNLQSARVLLGVIGGHAAALDELWYLCLTVCQHLSWLLAMRPSSLGLFTRDKTEQESNSSGPTTVTTAALSDIPVIASFLDKITAATSTLSDSSYVKVAEAFMRLSDEQMAVAATGRDCSLYPLASLLRISLNNLPRFSTFWTKTTTHFIKICSHTSAAPRDCAAASLTTLVRQALKMKTDVPDEEQQCQCLSALHSLCTTGAPEVRRRQLECLMAILQTDGSQLRPSTWPTLISIVSAVVDPENGCDEVLVRQGYLGVRLISADFLQSLPFDCVAALVEAISRYGQQLVDQNISLSALALLWTISDFVFRKSDMVGAEAAEKVWLVLYTCLSELCVDSRHSVRKSACQTFLQTVAAHGHALRATTWTHMIWQILMPLLDRVRSQTRSASTERSTSSLIMHHSRDTEQKQWTETCINTLSAACKMFNAQRKVLLQLDDFSSAWEALLSYLEWAACHDSAELALAALKSFQEVLLGRISAQTLDMNTRDRSSCSLESISVEMIPSLPQEQWIQSWNSWQRMSRGLAKWGEAATCNQGGVPKGVYVPGPSHLTALLHIFPALFERVARQIPTEEFSFEQLPSVMESLVNVPIPSEQTPFVLPSTQTQLTPTQEAVLDAVRSIYTECISSGSPLKVAIPDQIRLLLRFASLGTRTSSKYTPVGKNYRDWAVQCVIPFAETSLRLATEMYGTTGAYPELVRSRVLIDFVRYLGDPLYMKYACISPSTWKLAASSLMSILKVSLPLARQQAEHFDALWLVICETLEKFLFTPNTFSRLAADERKRDELMECQAVELVRNELLPHAARLPPAAVQRLIALLNRGSICQLDPTDVLASDSHAQRAELARTCFDALLSTSNDGDGSLGHVAVSSLLQRCTQVMSSFLRDWSGSGDLQLPRTRLSETISALQAVDSLIARLARDPSLTELYSQLVSLYPSVVEIVPCCRADPQLEAQIVSTLKSYQTLLLLKAVPNFST